jgi:8-amino-7-oxononanoate synthase
MVVARLQKELRELKEKNNYRFLRKYSENLINFSSNDYIGVAEDRHLREKFYRENQLLKLSSSSSRLITGNYPEVRELEKRLKEIYKREALVFNSGYDGNTCVIETIYNKNTLILSDRLNHASIYDGILESNATLMRYRHLDLDHLEEILKKNRNKYEEILVVTETIYSMDGDCVDLKKLIELKKNYGFDLMVDEAHSYGVYGYGIAFELDVVSEIDYLIIPLGKGGGSVGAYLLTSETVKNYLINKGRKFIYTTALPPINNCWNLFVLNNMNNFNNKRKRVKELTNYALMKIKEYNLKSFSTTHILSIIIGENKKTEEICNNMTKKGFLVYGVKAPTVPVGSARIRIGLNPNISEEDLDKFFEELNYEIDTVL